MPEYPTNSDMTLTGNHNDPSRALENSDVEPQPWVTKHLTLDLNSIGELISKEDHNTVVFGEWTGGLEQKIAVWTN